jgi:hypothetical protein
MEASSMLTHEEPLKLETLADGAAIERFNDALQVILENILDPNTGTKAREVNLKIKLKPDDNKDVLQITIECTPKLAPADTIISNAYLGKDISGKAIAHEIKRAQLPLIGSDNVVPMISKGTK